MEARIATTIESYPWLVFEEDGVIKGYAYAASFRARYILKTKIVYYLIALRHLNLILKLLLLNFNILCNPQYSRTAYRHTVETSVYVRQNFHGQGIGLKLYEELLKQLKMKGFHVAVAIMASPNPGSARSAIDLNFKRS